MWFANESLSVKDLKGNKKKRKEKAGLPCCCIPFPYLAVNVLLSHSPSTLTQIMCCILQANLNGRFLPNPLPMTSANSNCD